MGDTSTTRYTRLAARLNSACDAIVLTLNVVHPHLHNSTDAFGGLCGHHSVSKLGLGFRCLLTLLSVMCAAVCLLSRVSAPLFPSLVPQTAPRSPRTLWGNACHAAPRHPAATPYHCSMCTHSLRPILTLQTATRLSHKLTALGNETGACCSCCRHSTAPLLTRLCALTVPPKHSDTFVQTNW